MASMLRDTFGLFREFTGIFHQISRGSSRRSYAHIYHHSYVGMKLKVLFTSHSKIICVGNAIESYIIRASFSFNNIG